MHLSGRESQGEGKAGDFYPCLQILQQQQHVTPYGAALQALPRTVSSPSSRTYTSTRCSDSTWCWIWCSLTLLWNISTLLWGKHCALEPLTIWLLVVRADFLCEQRNVQCGDLIHLSRNTVWAWVASPFLTILPLAAVVHLLFFFFFSLLI